MEKLKLTGIILSGGKSLRMGQEKGLILFNGKPLIEYSIAVLTKLCDEIIICTNNSNYDYLGYKIVPDIFPDCGPMGGIYSGLLESQNEYCLVAPCDVPFLTDKIFSILLTNINENKIVLPLIQNEIQVLCGIYSKKCISELGFLLSQKKFKMLKIVDELGAKVISLDEDFKNIPDVFANINTPAELNKIENNLLIRKEK